MQVISKTGDVYSFGRFKIYDKNGKLKTPTGGGGASWGTITGTLSAQTDLQTALDNKVDENPTITGATKTKITYDAKGLVTGGADATTADINDSLNKRYVTDAQLTVIGNTSGTNTGDETTSSIQTKRPLKTINSQSLEGIGNITISGSGLTQQQVEGLI